MNQRLADWGRGAIAGLVLAICDAAVFLTNTHSELADDDLLRVVAVMALAGPIAGLVAGILLAPIAKGLRRHLPDGARALVGGLMLLGSLLLVYVDATVYVNLYAWAHWCLGIIALAAATLGALFLTWASWTRWFAIVALAALVLSPWLGPKALGSGQVVRRAIAQETTLISRVAMVWPGPARQVGPQACAWPTPTIPPRTGVAKPSILLLTIDAWRADVADNYFERTMPKLAKSVGNGARFTRAYAAATRTNESLYSLFTGRWPQGLNFVAAGVDENDHFREVDDSYSIKQSHLLPLRDKTPTLAELLTAHGYQSAAVVPYVFFLEGAGITRGFEKVDTRAYNELNRNNQGITSKVLTDQAIAWVSQAKAPWTLWIHYQDPHHPYEPYGDVSAAAPIFDRYVSELRRVDDQIERLLSHLGATKGLEDTVIVVAADHGEEFRDHGGLFHGTTVYEEQARVPLFIMGPGIEKRVIDGPVSLVDIAPTLLDLVGAPVHEPMDGQTQVGPLRGSSGASSNTRPLLVRSTWKGKRLGLVMGRHKYIYDVGNQVEEVYDLKLDPGEKKNRVDDLTEIRDQGRCLLRASGASLSP